MTRRTDRKKGLSLSKAQTIVVALFLVLVTAGIWVGRQMIRMNTNQRVQSLSQQVLRTSRTIETKYQSLIEDVQHFVELSILERLFDGGKEDQDALRTLKRFYSRHQETLQRITLQNPSGNWITIHRTDDSYYIVNRSNTPAPPIMQTRVPAIIRDNEIYHYSLPVYDSLGNLKFRFIASIDLPGFFRSETRGIFFGPDVLMWLADTNGNTITMITSDAPEAPRKDIFFEGTGIMFKRAQDGLSGSVQHDLDDGATHQAISAYSPLEIFTQVFVIGFTVDKGLLTNDLIRSAWILASLFIIAMLLSTLAFLKVLRQRELAVREARMANKAKTIFLANMSHEIRTPMTAILGIAQLLKASRNLGEEDRKGVDMIVRAGDNLLEIINDILDLSKVEVNRMEYASEPVNLHELVRELAEMHSVTAHEKGLQLQTKFDVLPEWVATDNVRLRQILINLLGNAVKFTDSGSVQFAVRNKSGPIQGPILIRFEITDTGPGMSEEDKENILNPFTQGRSNGKRPMGSGLGLTIANKMIIGLGGTGIHIRTQAGKGSTFSFELSFPLAAPPARKAETIEIPETMQVEILDKVRVLAAEDTPMNRMILSKIFKNMGVEHVTFVENGMQAVEAAAAHNFDIIFMDIEMPVLDGLEATRRLRELGVHTQVIAITAHAMKEHEKMCKDAGMNGFLAKPYKIEEIRELLLHSRTQQKS